MKKSKTQKSIILIATAFLFMFSNEAMATENELKASYWVFENNLNDKTYTVVKFYNTKDVVVYEKKIEGKYLSPKKREIKRLNKEMAQYNSSKTHLKTQKKK